MLGAPQKISLRMPERDMNNICLIHKIALVWSISRNIFQLMDYATSLVVQPKNVLFDFSEALYNSKYLLGCLLPKLPTKDNSRLKVVGNHYYRNRFTN